MKISNIFKSPTKKRVEALLRDLNREFVKVGIEKHNHKLTDIPGYYKLVVKESDLRDKIKLLNSIL
jgi:hypothetical protein